MPSNISDTYLSYDLKSNSLTKIEADIYKFSTILRKGWFYIGKMVLTVEQNKLYEQAQFKSPSAWLKALSKELDIQPSTLRKFVKIVKMLEAINFPLDQVNPKNVTGLEQIARIYDHTNDCQKALDRIKSLDEKSITIKELRQEVAEILNPPIQDYDSVSEFKMGNNIWTIFVNFLKTFLFPKPIIHVLPTLFVVLYITDIH